MALTIFEELEFTYEWVTGLVDAWVGYVAAMRMRTSRPLMAVSNHFGPLSVESDSVVVHVVEMVNKDWMNCII